MAHLRPHVNALDYPEAKHALLNLLAQYRQAIALPGEPLGVTNKVTHHFALQPGAQPSYVPSYWLPRSQRQVVQQVDELLQEGVIQESHSPWNSLLFLVPKKDSSYRPVIDFQKVNALTVPDHYPLPVVSELLQSIVSIILFLPALTFYQVSGRFPWMTSPGKLQRFPHLLVTMSGFAFQWGSAMHLLRFRGW